MSGGSISGYSGLSGSSVRSPEPVVSPDYGDRFIPTGVCRALFETTMPTFSGTNVSLAERQHGVSSRHSTNKAEMTYARVMYSELLGNSKASCNEFISTNGIYSFGRHSSVPAPQAQLSMEPSAMDEDTPSLSLQRATASLRDLSLITTSPQVSSISEAGLTDCSAGAGSILEDSHITSGTNSTSTTNDSTFSMFSPLLRTCGIQMWTEGPCISSPPACTLRESPRLGLGCAPNPVCTFPLSACPPSTPPRSKCYSPPSSTNSSPLPRNLRTPTHSHRSGASGQNPQRSAAGSFASVLNSIHPVPITPPHHLPKSIDVVVTPSPGTSYRKPTRKIESAPYRILDAPDLSDDFHLVSLMDYGANNILAVILGHTVYLMHGETGSVSSLKSLSKVRPSCLLWIDMKTLAVGLLDGDILLVNTESDSITQTITQDAFRVGCLSYNSETGVLASGSRDCIIRCFDIRTSDSFSIGRHLNEVCNLRWSSDNRFLASGGWDGVLSIWTAQRPNEPVFRASAEAEIPIRALAWSPHQSGLLGYGRDTVLKVMNTNRGITVNEVNTASLICSLLWAPNVNELISTHGDPDYSLMLWKCPSLRQLANLKNHRNRILGSCLTADGQTVISGAADETLRFWSLFPPKPIRRNSPADMSAFQNSLTLAMEIELSTIR